MRFLIKTLTYILITVILVWGLWQTPPIQKIYYPYPHRDIIEKYANQYGVDPLLVVSVIREESKFLPQSQSHKGAIGLMQLMPATADWIAQQIGDKAYNQEELRTPDKNIMYGTWYLASLAKEFSNNKILVLAAYNGGRGHVNEWIDTQQLKLNNLRVEDIPFKETREYVQRVLKSYNRYCKLYK